MSIITAPRTVRVTAARATARLLEPGETLTVRHRFAHTHLYAGRRGLVAITDPSASRSTCAVTVGSETFALLNDADCLLVGDRSLACEGLTLRVARTWRSRVPQMRRPAEKVIASFGAAVAESPRGLPLDAPLRPAALIGNGTGLTPAGDDVVCGALAAAHAWGDQRLVRQLWEATLPRLAATTDLSAQFLTDARRGDVAGELRELLMGLSGHSWRPTFDALMRVGHTSGADLAHGVLLVLQQLDHDEGELHR